MRQKDRSLTEIKDWEETGDEEEIGDEGVGWQRSKKVEKRQ